MIISMFMLIIMTTITMGMILTRAALIIHHRQRVDGHPCHDQARNGREYDHRVPDARMNARRKTRAQSRPSPRDARLKSR